MSSYGGAVSEELRPWIRVMYFDEKHGKLFTGWLCVLLTTVWFLSWLLMYPVSLHVLQIVQDVRERGKKARQEGERQDVDFDNQMTTTTNATKKKVGYGKTMTNTFTTSISFSTVRRDNSRPASHIVSNLSYGMDRMVPQHLVAYRRNFKSFVFYKIKLARELIFLSFAVPAGICAAFYVALNRDPLQEWLMKFSSGHQIVFTMAAGHFCCTIVEDYQTSFWLDAGMEIEGGSALFPLSLLYPYRHDKQLHLAYFVNHLMEIFVLIFILQTGKLAGLGVQCLLFEVPNLIDLRRRIDIAKDILPQWLSNSQSLKIHWYLVLLLFVICRGGSMGLWIYSLVHDDVLKEEFEKPELIVYYILVGYFTIVNLRTFVFLVRIANADQLRNSNFQEGLDPIERLRSRMTWAGLPKAGQRAEEAAAEPKVQYQVQFADLRASHKNIALTHMDSRYSFARRSQPEEAVMDLT